MARALFLFVAIAAVAAGGAWLADHPGRVALDWQGYRIETSAAVLLVAVAVVSAVAAVLYRIWVALRRSPATLGAVWRERSRRKGYQALSKGMVAVAAGDADEARRQSSRADGLLGDPPITLLLAAQSAQLNGDEDAAAAFFRRMLDSPDTEFLGVRGLLTQAVKRGEHDEALELARRAWRLQPKSGWVADQLFSQLSGAGLWIEADAVLDGARRRKAMDDKVAERRQWVVRHQAALAAPPEDALRRARKVNDANPDFVPGALSLARLWLADGKPRKAAAVIERTWASAPHPDLLDVYWQAAGAEDALARMRAAEKLAKRNPDHEESRLAVANQAIDAGLWGEARRHLAAALDAAGGEAGRRLFRAMAALEDAETGDSRQVRDWLMRASMADPDPAWVCRTCGHVHAAWAPACDHCAAFDSQDWTVPPHAKPMDAAPATVLIEGTGGADDVKATVDDADAAQ